MAATPLNNKSGKQFIVPLDLYIIADTPQEAYERAKTAIERTCNEPAMAPVTGYEVWFDSIEDA